LCYEVILKARRRQAHIFRDDKYALTAFIHGGALTCWRWKVTLEYPGVSCIPYQMLSKKHDKTMTIRVAGVTFDVVHV
jgi:hypothetical protein